MNSPRKQSFRRLIPFYVAVTIALGCDKLFAGDESAMSVIERTWRERQENVVSFRLRWKVSRILATSPKACSPFDGTDRKTLVPVAHEYEQLLAVQDGKYRFCSTEPAKNGQTGDWIRKESIFVSDGVKAKEYTKRDTSFVPRSGSVSKYKPLEQSFLGRMSDLRPVTFHFRPFLLSPRALEGFTVSKDRGEADGKPCVILRRLDSSTPTVTESLWLDPNQQYCIRRYAKEYEGKVWYQLELDYGQEIVAPVPTGWHEVMYFAGDGTLTKSVKATVISSEVNITLPDSEFDLTFPPGAQVLDSTGRGVNNGVAPDSKPEGRDLNTDHGGLRMFHVGADGVAQAVTNPDLIGVPSLEELESGVRRGVSPRGDGIGGGRLFAVGLCATLVVVVSILAAYSMVRGK